MHMVERIIPDRDRIRELEVDYGQITARRMVTREALEHAVTTASDIADIKRILLTMLDRDWK